jgi:hypothetical protein
MADKGINDKDLLDWILKQDQLRVEKWHHPGRRVSVSVWTNLDDEDTPSGHAADARTALVMALRHQQSLV